MTTVVNNLYGRSRRLALYVVDSVDNSGLTPSADKPTIQRVGLSARKGVFQTTIWTRKLSPCLAKPADRHSPARARLCARLHAKAALDRCPNGSRQFLLHYFTWWNGANFNTRFYTNRYGVLVGHDEFGNTYYPQAGNRPGARLRAAVGDLQRGCPKPR